MPAQAALLSHALVIILSLPGVVYQRRQHLPTLADALAAATAPQTSIADAAANHHPAALEPVRAYLALQARKAVAAEAGAATPSPAPGDAAAVGGQAAVAPAQDEERVSWAAAVARPEQQPAGARAAADPSGPRQGPGGNLGEALGEAAQWLVLLVVAAARARLPPQGLALLADLAQLLFCCAGPTAPPGHNLVEACPNQFF